MRIGIDFDNTIVDYDGVFHAAAMEQGLIAADLPNRKNAVRDFLNASGRKDDFTLLQGFVYGSRMKLARPYQGFRQFISAALASRQELFIVSHKTRFPLLGPKYDMHDAARAFLSDHGLAGDGAIPERNVFFEEDQARKIGRAAELTLDVFIDDLPEVLTAPALPSQCRRILFAPDAAKTETEFEVCRSWHEIMDRLFGIRQ